MAQHFAQAKGFRDLSLLDITKLSEHQSWEFLVNARWGGMDKVSCTKCGAVGKTYFIRTRKRWRCCECHGEFSVTTDSPFANRKLPFQTLLCIAFLCATSPKGVSANHICGLLDVTFRTAFQNLGKIREAMCLRQDRSPMQGLVQIDGCHVSGKPRRPRKRQKYTSAIANNHLKNRKAGMVPGVPKSQLEPWNAKKLENRRIVLGLVQLPHPENGMVRRTMTFIVKSESAAWVLPLVHAHVKKGTTIQTDDGTAYSTLSAWYRHQTVRHSVEYSTDDGANNNQAESLFSRLRRSEYGIYHGMRTQYTDFYAAETAWRADGKGQSAGTKFNDLWSMIFACDVSFAYRGYCQRRHLKTEYLN